MSERDFHIAFANGIIAGHSQSESAELITGLYVAAPGEEFTPAWAHNPRFSHVLLRTGTALGKSADTSSRIEPTGDLLKRAKTRKDVVRAIQFVVLNKIGTMLQLSAEAASDHASLLQQHASSLGVDSLIAVEIQELTPNIDPNAEDAITLEELTKPTAEAPNAAPAPSAPEEAVTPAPDVLEPLAAPSTNTESDSSSTPNSSKDNAEKASNQLTPSSVSPSNGESEAAWAPEKVMPMSYGQSRFWLMSQIVEDPCAFNQHGHQPVQRIFEESTLCLETISAKPSEVEKHFVEMHKTVYNLQKGELMRILLVSISPTQHHLLVGYHHINMDSSSLAVLGYDLQRLYAGQKLPPSRLQYLEFASYQLKRLRNGKKTRVTAKVASQVQALCRKARVTPFHLYTTVLQVLIARLTSMDDFCIGMADANRSEIGATDSVGNFLNLLPIRLKSAMDKTIRIDNEDDPGEGLKCHPSEPWNRVLTRTRRPKAIASTTGAATTSEKRFSAAFMSGAAFVRKSERAAEIAIRPSLSAIMSDAAESAGREPGFSFTILSATLFLIPLYIVWTILYSLFLHRLRSFPGPRIPAVTRIPFWIASLRGNQVRWLHSLHRKHGPVVRFGPSDLSYTGAQAWKDIYGYRKGKKENFKDPKFYPPPESGTPSLSTLNVQEHTTVRRTIAPAFSDRALKEQEPLFQRFADLMVATIRKATGERGKNGVDMVKIYNLTTFDIMAQLTYGESLGLLEASEYTPADRLDKRLARGSDQPDIWNLILDKDGEQGLLTVPQMHSNAQLFMAAGTETSTTLLSGLTYLLLTNPGSMQILTDEIRGAFKLSEQINFDSIARLPYLNACIEEGLRMYPPVPSGFPRVTPEGGNTIVGQWIPPGVSVSVHTTSSYRDPKNFKDPDSMAWHEMRLLLSKVLFNFDLQLCDESRDWADQKVYILWQKKPLMCRAVQVTTTRHPGPGQAAGY
ncbi:hypothetical protein DL764_010045 [Monosporascus ibericus]|uniref:Condensation domain-containing protein n=1 Tax=Monosporascus ibericus TaxID=155417 RepID=A0A4Q4SVS8_9PEZI|nr:hypothetical protein DL764_010045 [Monosporascus ibericus]